MDTEFDFIQPEFLDALFFQQKNLVVFPYVDLKHLHSLEIFTVGHNVVDLESTALYNLKEIIEFEAINSYSQNKSFYFIYNLDQDKIRDIISIPDIRCVLNTNENVSSLVEGTNNHNFIFYNKKTKKFLNYDKSNSDLEFETHLISSSENTTVLHEKIQKIKIVATRIFIEINQNPELDNLSEILKDYDRQYWPKILDFVKFYFNVEVPDLNKIQVIPSHPGRTQKSASYAAKKPLKDFSDEYELIVNSNKLIAREFILLLHDYRSEKVNPSNLDLDQLFNPQKLYNYLRNHHWKEGISEDFLFDWVQMSRTKYQLGNNDADDFEILLKKLKVNEAFVGKLLDKIIVEGEEIENKIIENEHYGHKPLKNKFITIKKPLDIPDNNVPSVRNFPKFKKWLLRKIEDVEMFLDVPLINEESEKSLIAKPNMNSGTSIDILNNNYVIDGANVAFEDKTLHGKAKFSNIQRLKKKLENINIKNYKIICDRALRHKIDEPEIYAQNVENKEILETPAGTEADPFILQYARSKDAYIISNDRFQEFYASFGEEWINEKRITFKFIDQDIFFDKVLV